MIIRRFPYTRHLDQRYQRTRHNDRPTLMRLRCSEHHTTPHLEGNLANVQSATPEIHPTHP